MLPALLHERLPEIGIDVAVVYASYFIVYFTFDDDEYRQVACRATNDHVAEMCVGLEDRLLPVASIPMHTLAEALAELEHCAGLGYRAFVFAGAVTRRDGSGRTWVDTTSSRPATTTTPCGGCARRTAGPPPSTPRAWAGAGGSPATTRSQPRGPLRPGVPRAGAGPAVLRRRHPPPRPAVPVLEGGPGWAGSLYADLSSHYAKRNRETTAPTTARPWTGRWWPSCSSATPAPGWPSASTGSTPRCSPSVPRWPRCPTTSPALDGGEVDPTRIESIFSTQIFAGCEGDDPLNALLGLAQADLLGTRLNGILGSDIGHWDLPDAGSLIHETRELVESGHLDEADYREFVATNPARLWAGPEAAREFFVGTVVEGAVDDLLSPIGGGRT